MAAVGVLEANITRTWIRWASGHHITKTGEQAVPNRMPTASVGAALRFAFHVRTWTYILRYVHTWSYVCRCVCACPLPSRFGHPWEENSERASEQRAVPTWACSRPRPRPPHDQPWHRCRREAEAPEIHARGRSSFWGGRGSQTHGAGHAIGGWAGGQGPLLADKGGKWAAGRSLSGCRRFRPRAEPKYMRLST